MVADVYVGVSFHEILLCVVLSISMEEGVAEHVSWVLDLHHEGECIEGDL